jgi:asparagine synthase (glutamine-hydrolysing)
LVAQVKRSLDLAAHRGPDGWGLVFGDGRIVLGAADEERATWVLGHRRLSIIDLSPAGAQPMTYADGRLWITYNGEVYNYIELREELKTAGYHFRTQTDTEVVLAAYHRWGEACVERFVGMFAFVLLDLQEGTVFAARDRLGVKPLYVWPDATATVIVSEPKQLLAFERFSPRADRDQAVDYLIDGALGQRADGCLFAGVRQLPRAHVLSWPLDSRPDLGSARRYWEPRIYAADVSWEDAVEKTRVLFRDAVRLRLRSDVPVGTCLSGGVDSSSIVGIVSRDLGQRLQAFSSVFTSPAISEERYVDAVAAHCSVPVTKVRPSVDEAVDDLDAVVYSQDEPFGSLSVYAQWRVMRAARAAGVPVLLDGQGGDEALCGYHAHVYVYMRQLVAQRHWANLASQAWQSGTHGDAHLWTRLGNWARHFTKRRQSSDECLLEHLNRHRAHLTKPHAKGLSLKEYQLALLDWLLSVLLRYEDRNSMAHSIEARVPFVDHRFLEHCLSLPEAFFFRRGRTKRLLVGAVGDALPRAVRERRTKLSFDAPDDDWFKGKLGQHLAARAAASPRAAAVFDMTKLKDAFEEYRRIGGGHSSRKLFRAACFVLWLERFQLDV